MRNPPSSLYARIWIPRSSRGIYLKTREDFVLARVFAVANQKGGVGKTTSCINIAAALALAKRRVLLIDLDPQGNATTGSGVDKSALTCTINDVLLEQTKISNSIIKLTAGGYDVIGANQALTESEVRLLETPHKEKGLRLHLASVLNQYDYILFDCPPSLNMLTLNPEELLLIWS